MKLKSGNWYLFKESNGTQHKGQYIGNQTGFECCVCGKGHKAKTFNIWYNGDNYETWGFGNEHLLEMIEDLGKSETIIIDE